MVDPSARPAAGTASVVTVSDRVAAHLGEAAAVGPDEAAAAACAARVVQLIRPAGALAALDEVAIWLAGWQRRARPAVQRPAVVVFVADHGVAARGVSAYPASVTAAMLDALRAGTATVTALAATVGAEVHPVDVGAGHPTGDLAVEDALDPERFEQAWFAGAGTVARLDTDLLAVGEMGIANTTAAAAVAAGVFGGPARRWCGRGTGVDDAGLERKRAAVDAGLERLGHRVAPLEALRRVGGAELVAIAGAVTEARRRSVPVVLDGFVTTAAAAPLARAVPGLLDHTRAAHRSAEAGHGLLLARLGQAPLLELDLRLGEGSGATLAVGLVRAAAAAVSAVATFDEAGVADRER
jgi:nicotinate-nucleotide--dimethylbenzimidazole phosphoribosyltransferase